MVSKLRNQRLKKWRNCSWNQESCCRVKSFVKNLQEILDACCLCSSSSGRAGKPIVKWNEVQNWFTTRQQESKVKVPSVTNTYKDESGLPQTCLLNDGDQSSQILKGLVSKVGEKVSDLSELEFEAKSSTDGAWYDVDMFLSHRVTSSGETFVLDLSDLELRRMNGLM
ncbi:hypothetical protein ES319_D13G221100v1 [Gossypium barbadense]|uniref:SAWADEE domain-containing protein n=1 Tax=Gossypium barbadense TaxID=3634 RepID=A0A5J5NQ93_GOSBA|nr:hypothetical protein ES319_D13G221100v1 [Gossypium barbadense]